MCGIWDPWNCVVDFYTWEAEKALELATSDGALGDLVVGSIAAATPAGPIMLAGQDIWGWDDTTVIFGPIGGQFADGLGMFHGLFGMKATAGLVIVVILGLVVAWFAKDLLIPILGGAARRRSGGIVAGSLALVAGLAVGVLSGSLLIGLGTTGLGWLALKRKPARHAISDVRSANKRSARAPGDSQPVLMTAIRDRRRQPVVDSYNRKSTELVGVRRGPLGIKTLVICAADKDAAEIEAGPGFRFVEEARCPGNQLKVHCRYEKKL